MQLFDLISNIGGILGLFVGLSFVNLFEIGEILFEICFIFSAYYRKKVKKFQGNSNATFSQSNDLEELKLKIHENERKLQQLLNLINESISREPRMQTIENLI